MIKKKSIILLGVSASIFVVVGISIIIVRMNSLSKSILTTQVLSSSYPKMTLADLTKESELIIVGKVIAKNVTKEPENGDSHVPVYTYYTIAVEEFLKGDTSKEIIVRQMGGTLDDVTVVSPDDIELEQNKTTILFLAKDAWNYYVILGGPQGRYTVSTDKIIQERERFAVVAGERYKSIRNLDELKQVFKELQH